MARTIYVAVAFMIATVVVQAQIALPTCTTFTTDATCPDYRCVWSNGACEATCPCGYEYVVDGDMGGDGMTSSSFGEAGVVSIQACSNLCTSNRHVTGQALSSTCMSFEWRIEANPPTCHLNDVSDPTHLPSGNSALSTYCKASSSPRIDLCTAGEFVLLTRTGVTTTGLTSVDGNMGTSPIGAVALTGFGLIPKASNQCSLISDGISPCSTSALVNGEVYAGTQPMLIQAIFDMETAYADAAGRMTPDTTELGAGSIEGRTLQGGLHKWTSSVGFTDFLYFDAGNNEDTVFILQIAQDLVLGTGAQVKLLNKAKASNIFWQVAGQTQIPAGAHVKGIILCKTAIIFGAGSSLNGRGLAQTAVTMIATTIAGP